MKKRTKSNKKVKIFRVFIILCNHHFIILKLFRAIKSFILYQIKQTALKSGYNFTSYGKFTDARRIANLKPLSPIWDSSSITGKRQALASHINIHFINGRYYSEALYS